MLGAKEASLSMLQGFFKPRRPTSRKGDNGVVAVVGGSYLYHGAPTLAALACLRSGVDLVYLAVPKVIVPSVRALSPNLIVFPLPDAKLTKGCVKRLLKWLPDVDALLLGPGVGKQQVDGMLELVKEVSYKGIRMVLDADALMPEVVRALKGRSAVITPHAGEFRRLFGENLEEGLEARIEQVREKASAAGLVILLKGHVDIISNGNEVVINRSGTPAMTVGGTGDVLAGLLAGLLAQMEPFPAAITAAHINGLAGERCSQRLGFHILATDLIEELPQILKQFDRLEGA